MDIDKIQQIDLQKIFHLAKQLAISAAVVHRKGLEKHISVQTKSTSLDLVSEIDIETQKVIVERILQERPNDSIISKEGNNYQGSSGVCWIIDPLDGTVNYLHGFPAYGISIGVEIENIGVVGVVFDTYHQQIYTGIIDKQAMCDNENISVSNCGSLQNALVATGFLPDRKTRTLQGKLLTEILPDVQDIRRSGSPVIDLCRVASGVIDGFYEFGLKKWDISAGSIIAQAAGAKVSIIKVEGELNPLTVASTPKIHEQLLEMVLQSWEKTRKKPNLTAKLNI